MGRSRKYKYPFGLFKYDHSSGYFICTLCGMEVERHHRTSHLKYYHKDIYEKYIKKEKEKNR